MTDASKPTIILVHGAFADASGWSAVYRELTELGYPVYAPSDPLRGVAHDSQYIRSFVSTIDGPVVLAGHSYGGCVITNASAGSPAVKALVYVAAFAPDEGETLVELNSKFPPPPGLAHLQPDSLGFLWFDPAAIPDNFAQDIPVREARVLAAVQKPIAARSSTDPAGPPAWRTLPSWYLVSTQDRMINPDLERFMADRIGATTVEVRSSHASPASHPDQVARLILAAAQVGASG